jgi:hypothetical protein
LHFGLPPHLGRCHGARAAVLRHAVGWDGFARVGFAAAPFHGPDFDTLKAKLKSTVIFDGRNLYDPVLSKA